MAVSVIGQTGQSDEIHSPRRAQKRSQPDLARILVDSGGLDRRDLVQAQAFPDDLKTARQRCITKGPVVLRGNGERMVAVSAFSGSVSSPWAMASAAAMAPMVSLERCIGGLHVQQVERRSHRIWSV